MRYIPDFYIPLLLGAYFIIWAFDQQIKHIPVLRWLFWLVIISLAIATAGIGFFAGFDIPPQFLRIENPHLFGSLATFWNHQYNQVIALIGEPAAWSGTLARITARVLGIFSR